MTQHSFDNAALGWLRPVPDENAPIGSPEHRLWHLSVRPICYETVVEAKSWPCCRTRGHEGDHNVFWEYEDEYPETREEAESEP